MQESKYSRVRTYGRGLERLLMREGCGVPQNGTPWDTVHLHHGPLQRPRATVHPPSTSSSLHLRLFIHGLLFIQPPPCATPPATVQPPLHGHPSTIYCSSSPPPHHGVLFIQRQHHRSLFIQPPSPLQCSLFIQRGNIDRLQLAAVAKESLDWVQLTAIDRSLGFSNA